jgi:hypothetical protein
MFCVFLFFSSVYAGLLLIAALCLFAGGVLFSIAAAVSIVATRTCWLGLVPVALCLLISGAVLCVVAEMEAGVRGRMRALAQFESEDNLRRLREAMVRYAENNGGYLPEAGRWCAALVQDSPGLTETHFHHPLYDPNSSFLEEVEEWFDEHVARGNPEFIIGVAVPPGPEGECNYAFNANLSGRRLSEMPGDCVLLFEANGDWNVAGTQEVLNSRYSKYWYVSLIYVDGRTGRYWFREDRVETVSEDGKTVGYVEPKWNP